MKKRYLFIFLLVNLVLSCNTTKSKKIIKPNVLKVDTVLIESSKGNQESGATSIIEFNIYFDKNDISDISSIVIESSEGSKWSFDRDTISNKYNSKESKLYFESLTSSLHKHYLPLGNYSLIVNYENNPQLDYSFFVYGRGDVNMTSGRIYTEEVDETPKILSTPTSYTAFIDGDNLVLNFTSTDEIINNGYIWVYNNDGNCIATEGWFSDSKNANSIGENQYVFDISNIKDDVKHVELVLYSDITSMNDKTIYWCRTGSFPISE